MDVEQLMKKADMFIEAVDRIELENAAAIRSREQCIETISRLKDENNKNSEAYDIATHAIEILKGISNDQVHNAYQFIEGSINDALAKMFKKSSRAIKIHEYLRDDKYPQLEIELIVENGEKRSIKTGSGHGIAQIISILSILCLIVLTGARRILCIDEVLSGLSTENRMIMTDILWCFTDIGFQFLIIEHGYIPRGAKVYELELNGGIGRISDEYIAESGVYLQSNDVKDIEYKDIASTISREDSDTNVISI